jgi:hypothetical protein
LSASKRTADRISELTWVANFSRFWDISTSPWLYFQTIMIYHEMSRNKICPVSRCSHQGKGFIRDTACGEYTRQSPQD